MYLRERFKGNRNKSKHRKPARISNHKYFYICKECGKQWHTKKPIHPDMLTEKGIPKHFHS